jgi:dolichyl-phosphate beta-glucosyltransferase
LEKAAVPTLFQIPTYSLSPQSYKGNNSLTRPIINDTLNNTYMQKISFVIPIYNESTRLHKTLEALNTLRLPKQLSLAEVLFVNDGSTDNTLRLLKHAKSNLLIHFTKAFPTTEIVVVSYKQNQGKGFAIKQGMLRSSADYTLFFDADMSTPLSQVTKFVPFMKKGIDVIIGTRKNGRSTVIMHQPLLRELLGKLFTKTAKTILQVDTTDFTCGFKAFSKQAREAIFSTSRIKAWGYDGEVLFLAKKYNFSQQEVPVLWSNDPNTKVKIYKAIPQTLIDLFRVHWYHHAPKTPSLTPSPQIRSMRLATRITSIFL